MSPSRPAKLEYLLELLLFVTKGSPAIRASLLPTSLIERSTKNLSPKNRMRGSSLPPIDFINIFVIGIGPNERDVTRSRSLSAFESPAIFARCEGAKVLSAMAVMAKESASRSAANTAWAISSARGHPRLVSKHPKRLRRRGGRRPRGRKQREQGTALRGRIYHRTSCPDRGNRRAIGLFAIRRPRRGLRSRGGRDRRWGRPWRPFRRVRRGS